MAELYHITYLFPGGIISYMNLIFDFDGTICDSLEKSIELVNQYAKKHHLSLVTADIVRTVGIKKLVLQYKFSPLEISKLLIIGRKQIARFIPDLKTFKGFLRVVEKLSLKHNLYIITSNDKKNVALFLKNNNLDTYFKEINDSLDLFGKHHKLMTLIKKHKLLQDDTYYIGDETRDIEAAQKAGIHSIAVTWGYESKKLLDTAHPELIIDKPEELLEI